MAYGIPRINLRHPRSESRTGKQAAYAATWELSSMPSTIDISEIAVGVTQAMAADRSVLRQHSNVLAAHYRDEFDHVVTLLR